VLGTALLIAATSLVIVLPLLPRSSAFLFAIGLITLDLIAIAVFGRHVLNRAFVRPVEQLVEDTGRIAAGDHEHRVGPMPGAELEAIRTSVNELADRLVTEQRRLIANVRSLDRTNAELVATRSELIQTARLVSVGTLAAGIAHEVGNPLGALVGFCDLARMRAEREGQDTELLEAVREEAGRIDRIVRTLLQYARGQGESEAGAVRVHDVLGRVVELLEAQGRLAGIDVRLGREHLDATVFGQAQQLEQIALNLMLNAVDAMEGMSTPILTVGVRVEEGGFTRLPRRRDDDPEVVDYTHLRRVASDLEPSGPDALFTADRVVAITVEDSGPGIDMEEADRLFDPFYTTKAPGKGTGLGLAICARLADGMGGRIQAEAAEDGGARFVVRLPVYAPGDEGSDGLLATATSEKGED